MSNQHIRLGPDKADINHDASHHPLITIQMCQVASHTKAGARLQASVIIGYSNDAADYDVMPLKCCY